MSIYRNTEEDMNRYGSDFNKFCHDRIQVTFTIINGDAIMYKRDRKMRRLIEEKHYNEKIGSSQLEILIDHSKNLQPLEQNGYYDVYIIRGEIKDIQNEYPNGIDIIDVKSGNIKYNEYGKKYFKANYIHLNQDEIKKFCTFEDIYGRPFTSELLLERIQETTIDIYSGSC